MDIKETQDANFNRKPDMKSIMMSIINPARRMLDFVLPKYLLPLLILAFVTFKLQYLNLPFYWDEAWSYATAIFDMHENGLAILPGGANPDLTRGHPLFFYFISALWIRLFGENLIAVHTFPLILSVLLIVVLFKICRDLFNWSTAIITVSFFMAQSIYLAQSTMLLPEVLLALLTLTSLLAYIKKKWGLFVLSTCLLVMTKETGMVLITALIVDRLLLSRMITSKRNDPSRIRNREILFICIPAMLFIAYLAYQKTRLGWIFYPDHLDMLTFQPGELLNKSKAVFSRLFLQNGRTIFLIVSVACSFPLLYHNRFTSKQKQFLLFSMVFIILFVAFSVVNFFTTRYLLSVLPVYLMAGSIAISTFLSSKRLIRTIIVLVLVVLFIYQTCCRLWNESDVSLGYRDTVLVQKELVNYAESRNWNDKLIYSAFLMQYYLAIPRLGYLNDKTRPFYEVKNLPDLPYDLYIFCSNENDPNYEKIAGSSRFVLVKRFERKKSWAEVYSRVNNRQ